MQTLCRHAQCRLIGAAVLIAGALSLARAHADVSGSAFVQDDGSLRIRNQTIHLWGIYIPETLEDCMSFQRPPQCGPRAALALEFRIQGFVHCEERAHRRGRVLEAVCYADRDRFDEGTDLAAYLLSQGWALAQPGAPVEYHLLERIARETGLGVWGLPGVVRP